MKCYLYKRYEVQNFLGHGNPLKLSAFYPSQANTEFPIKNSDISLHNLIYNYLNFLYFKRNREIGSIGVYEYFFLLVFHEGRALLLHKPTLLLSITKK